MRKVFLLFSLLCITIVSAAQDGSPVLTHYRESRNIEDQSWAICQDKNKVMLFANRKGVLTFDGQEWASARIPVIPYSIQMNPYDGKIYVGGENSCGLIEKSENGLYWFVPLSADSSESGLKTKIFFDKTFVWFYGEKNISSYNSATTKKESVLTPGEESFSGMFITPQNTFVNISNKGLFRVENGALQPAENGAATKGKDILFALPYDERRTLLGFSDSKLSLFDGTKFYDYRINDNGYLKDNILSEGICIGDSLYAFSTLAGGAIIINKKSPDIRFTLNSQSGLPDDEIFALGYDKSGGLWMSHQYGLTRADLSLPVANFSYYPGLHGSLITSIVHNNEVYVATNEGVYYLQEVKNYSEVEVLIKKEAEFSKETKKASAASLSLQRGNGNEPQNTRKGIFNRIFGKKSTPVKNQVKISEPVIEIHNETPSDKFVWQKVSKLKSIEYIYKKVDGFDEKCRQLVSTRNGIIAATNRGLFLINNHKSTVLVKDRYINSISWKPFEDNYLITANDGYFLVNNKNGKWSLDVIDPEFNTPLYSGVQQEKNILWLGGENIAWRAVKNEKIKYDQFTIKNDFPQRYLLNDLNDSIFLFNETGVNIFNERTGDFEPVSIRFNSTIQNKSLNYPLSNIPLINLENEWIFTGDENRIDGKDISLLKLFDDIISVYADNKSIWIIDGDNNLYRINRKKSSRIISDTDLFIKNIKNEEGTSFDLSHIVFNRGDNVINFDIVAPTYLKKNLTEYQYTIDKVMDDWSPWSTQTSYARVISKSGDYTLQIRARDLWGEIGQPVSIMFTIKAPITHTTLFYIVVVIFFLLIVFVFIRFRERQLQEENRKLEIKVKERTAKIAAQNEEITSSIEYASRIQMAMLPMTDLFSLSFSDYFIIFKPRDIVSGDFYWIGEDEKHIFVTVADCTGHGVPGAFMSTLGISVLNEIVTHNRDLQANTVLNMLREKIKNSLHQTGKEGEAADGMDISLCVVKKDRKSIQFSGAYNPLLICTDGELKEYKADRMPIGIHYGTEASFTNYEISVKQGDVFYIFSDGLTDQFGGPDGSKYKKANFKKLLSDICHKPMSEQNKIIEYEFRKWKGIADQVDDITIIGIRV